MIGKNTIKLIKSLSDKKNRVEENLFLVEGDKNVLEILGSELRVKQLFATSEFITDHSALVKHALQIAEVSKKEIDQASLLKNPQKSLALCTLPDVRQIPSKLDEGLSVYLENIQDPGNLGTIIRICDWFGIKQLFCSPDTADFFNPKVIQASMGSFCRVKVCYATFNQIFKLTTDSGIPVYGAVLDGSNLYELMLPNTALLVLGNEGNGITADTENQIQNKIKIPSFAENKQGAESLNVAMAAAVICAEFKRQVFYPGYSK